MKILVIDDDQFIRELLAKTLVSYSYTVEVATDGQTGLMLIATYTYDLIISDVSLPKLDGIKLCRELRAKGDRTPILLLAEIDTSANIAAGLDAGADDYVIKPFNAVELLARVRALLRRKDSRLVPSEVTWGELCLNPVSAEVTHRGNLLSFTPKEYGLLELLLQNPQRVFSRSAILDRIWSSEVSPIEGTVTNHIKELRQKLKAAGMTIDIIETVYGLGYRLKAPPPQQALPALEQMPHPASGQFAKVMILEDDRATLEALSYLLHPWGLQVISLNHPDRFWEIFQSTLPDLLIFNLEMLSLNSIELCRRVRQDSAWGDLPIVAMTTDTDAESVRKMFALGVDDFVSKPIVGPELVTRVVSRLERLRQKKQANIRLTHSTDRQPESLKQATSAAHANLLLVDDQPDNLRVLSAILAGKGYKIRKAISGEIALDAIATQPPELILLDIKMPGMNGYEVCATLQANEQTRQIPVIFLSALEETSDKIKAFTVGGADYITKPFQAEEVLARIKHQLVIRQQQQQLSERNRQLQSARESLRESEAQFRCAFDQVAIGMGLIGLNEHWLKVNPALCQLLGYTEFELLAIQISTLVFEADWEYWQRCLQQVLNNQVASCQLAIRYRCKNDRIIWVLVDLSLGYGGSNQPFYALVQVQTIANH
jgi:PAS domain S-box-containing protein